MLYDMHCHVGLMDNAEDVATDAEKLELTIFSCEISPSGFLRTREKLESFGNIRVGLGLHPWWIARGELDEEDIVLLCHLATTEPLIGEVGLDFSARGLGTSERENAAELKGAHRTQGGDEGNRAEHIKELQVDAFTRLCETLAAHPLPGRIMSVHAVQSVSTVLNILEETGLVGKNEDARTVSGAAAVKVSNATRPAIILHWFSGSSDELARARALGCYFSVSELMMRSRRGREYARQVPLARLLLETDAPPHLHAPYSAQAIAESLNRTLDQLASLRRADRSELAAAIAANSARLIG